MLSYWTHHYQPSCPYVHHCCLTANPVYTQTFYLTLPIKQHQQTSKPKWTHAALCNVCHSSTFSIGITFWDTALRSATTSKSRSLDGERCLHDFFLNKKTSDRLEVRHVSCGRVTLEVRHVSCGRVTDFFLLTHVTISWHINPFRFLLIQETLFQSFNIRLVVGNRQWTRSKNKSVPNVKPCQLVPSAYRIPVVHYSESWLSWSNAFSGKDCTYLWTSREGLDVLDTNLMPHFPSKRRVSGRLGREERCFLWIGHLSIHRANQIYVQRQFTLH